MALYTFKTDPELGLVVDKYVYYCKLTPTTTIPNFDYVRGNIQQGPGHYSGLVGAKHSSLCGFKFLSKLPADPRTFGIVYCPKLASSIGRTQRSGMSGWYCWQFVSIGNIMVLSKEDMLNRYGFNVDKFFQSDSFEKMLPILKRQIIGGIRGPYAQFKNNTVDPESRRWVERYEKALYDAYDVIDDVVEDIANEYSPFDDVDDEDSEEQVATAKLAYNANNTYALRDLDKKTGPEQQKGA